MIFEAPADGSQDPPTPQDLEGREVFSVCPGDQTFYRDAEFLDAVWTEQAIPAERVNLCSDWREVVLPARSGRSFE
jgi:hypothetical protein